MTDITPTDRYECLAALYFARFGRLAPGKDDRTRDSSSRENIAQFGDWRMYSALDAALTRILELERELAAARAALEGDHR